MRNIAMAVVCMTLLSCLGSVTDHRARLMRESILFCTSQYSFEGHWREEISVGFADSSLNKVEDVINKWSGILTDPEFRSYLTENGIDPIEFQESVTACQEKYLDDAGYHDFIRPLP